MTFKGKQPACGGSVYKTTLWLVDESCHPSFHIPHPNLATPLLPHKFDFRHPELAMRLLTLITAIGSLASFAAGNRFVARDIGEDNYPVSGLSSSASMSASSAGVPTAAAVR